MKTENETLGAGSPSAMAAHPPQYATLDEVQQALHVLTDADHAKLIMIAAAFCRQRRLTRSECEPKELLNQAVLKTLECDQGKQWNKRVSMVRHLDRAMENISGHLVRERMKIVSFPDGQTTGVSDMTAASPAVESAARERATALMNAVFGDDDRAKEIFILRGQGYRPSEIQTRLGISATEYETTNRRILRRIFAALNKKVN